MNKILHLDQQDFDPSAPGQDRSTYLERRAARAVVFDDVGAVALLHAGVLGYYKLPGGGIDANEEIAEALAREIMEEIGSVAEVTTELGIVEEWRDADQLHQISYSYAARLKGQKGAPTFTEKEINEGFEVVWARDIDDAIRLVEESTDSDDFRVKFMTLRDAAILRTARQALLAEE